MRERTDPTKIAMLRRLPGLEGTADEELALLAADLDVVDVGTGRCLLRQGRGGRWLFLVVTGRASVHRDGVHVADVGHGAVVGDVATRCGRPRNATVIAETPMRLLVANPGTGPDVLERIERLAGRSLPVPA